MTAPPAIDEDLYFEILKSEQLRVRVLMVVMATLFAATSVLAILPREWVPLVRLVQGEVPFVELAAFYGAGLLYELIAQSSSSPSSTASCCS